MLQINCRAENQAPAQRQANLAVAASRLASVTIRENESARPT